MFNKIFSLKGNGMVNLCCCHEELEHDETLKFSIKAIDNDLLNKPIFPSLNKGRMNVNVNKPHFDCSYPMLIGRSEPV